VSTDRATTHASFADRLGLPYPLVSDRDAGIASAYGVARLGGWLPSRRVTFVIDRDGVVRRVIESELDVRRHVEQAVQALRKLEGEG
jgi:peroxiredoxin Q/BCP